MDAKQAKKALDDWHERAVSAGDGQAVARAAARAQAVRAWGSRALE